MTLLNRAYLEIEGTSGTATFEFHLGLEHESQINKNYLMGARGQYISEAVNMTPGTGNVDGSRRRGFWIDGGAGEWTVVVAFKTGEEGENIRWGDGSGGTGQSNVTEDDASGAGVAAISRKQILQNWIAKSKSDSGATTRIHVGEWSDGSVSGVTGVSSGVFGKPMPVAIQSTNFRGPQTEQGETASFEGEIEMAHVGVWGGYDAPDWATDAVGAALDAAEYIPDV